MGCAAMVANNRTRPMRIRWVMLLLFASLSSGGFTLLRDKVCVGTRCLDDFRIKDDLFKFPGEHCFQEAEYFLGWLNVPSTIAQEFVRWWTFATYLYLGDFVTVIYDRHRDRIYASA